MKICIGNYTISSNLQDAKVPFFTFVQGPNAMYILIPHLGTDQLPETTHTLAQDVLQHGSTKSDPEADCLTQLARIPPQLCMSVVVSTNTIYIPLPTQTQTSPKPHFEST
jgi:hypothetical protein